MTEQSEPIIIADTDDIAKIKAELKRTDEPKKWQYFLSFGPQLAAAFANSTFKQVEPETRRGNGSVGRVAGRDGAGPPTGARP